MYIYILYYIITTMRIPKTARPSLCVIAADMLG